MVFPGVAMVEIQGIQADDATAWWPHVAEWCEAALAHGGGLLDLDDVKAAVADRRMQLWAISLDGALTAVCVTSIHQWSRACVLTAIIVGGEGMHNWVAALDDVLTRYAREKGCRFVDAHGRKGWHKVLGSLGWKESTISYMKEV